MCNIHCNQDVRPSASSLGTSGRACVKSWVHQVWVHPHASGPGLSDCILKGHRLRSNPHRDTTPGQIFIICVQSFVVPARVIPTVGTRMIRNLKSLEQTEFLLLTVGPWTWTLDPRTFPTQLLRTVPQVCLAQIPAPNRLHLQDA